ncbi:MAG: heparinase II/III family protein [Phycisphaerae bacterium]|nr:heparinase II/III family protein [Phycisphaerae bacterium]
MASNFRNGLRFFGPIRMHNPRRATSVRLCALLIGACAGIGACDVKDAELLQSGLASDISSRGGATKSDNTLGNDDATPRGPTTNPPEPPGPPGVCPSCPPDGSGQIGISDEISSTTEIAPNVGQPLYSRTPQWPLKTRVREYSVEQLAQLRMLTSTHPNSITYKAQLIDWANYWVSVPDEQLNLIIPDHRVPRAIDVSESTDGCPIHGTAIYAYGSYPWILDRERPYQLKCPVGNEVYPSNDFTAYYRTGLIDQSRLQGSYPDDGFGWRNPNNGRKYWFVAYAVHWHYRNTWIPAVLKLAQAYAVTGDRIYARKAIAMLDRIASVYPSMNYRTQSRESAIYGQRAGKIVNSLWEYQNLRSLAIAYDLVFDTLVGQNPISLPWRTSLEIRRNIEANLLEESFEAFDRLDIDGTYGAHQNAIMHAALVRDSAQAESVMRNLVFAKSSAAATYEGFNYALYNVIFKDGFPIVTSPNYNGYWVENFSRIAEIGPQLGIDLFGLPRMSRVFDAPLELLCAGGFTPNNGDSGNIYTREMLPPTSTYEIAYRITRDPRYAWALAQFHPQDDLPFNSFDECVNEYVFDAALADAQLYNPVKQSRVLDGYGMAILNNRSDKVAVSMNYGIRSHHGHKDRLNIELFAHGSRISPDLGYPDFADATTPGRFGWTANTISHNTVMVDGVPQEGNDRGTVLRFHRGTNLSVVDVDAPTSYPNTSQYRRTLVLVEVGEDAYLVDVFRVKGGGHHVLSLHGHEGGFALSGENLSAPVTGGTFAGPFTAYGANNGSAAGPPSYNSFYSGYSFLYNWQSSPHSNMVTGNWSHTDGSMLRVHVAPNAGQELVVADGRASPLQIIPAVLKYMLLRRYADASGTTFVTVWELARSPIITGPVTVSTDAALGSGADRTVVLKVPRGATTDTISVAAQPGATYTLEPGLTSDAAVSVLGRVGATWERAFAAGGSHLTGSQALSVPQTLTGTVSTLSYSAKTVTADVGTSAFDPATLVGRTVRIYNALHSSVHTIIDASRSGTVLTLTLGGDSELLVGRIKISQVLTAEKHIMTTSSTPYPSSLRGMFLVRQDYSHAERIESTVSYTRYILRSTANLAPFSAALSAGEDLWIADFGTGDTIEIEGFGESGA